MPQRERGVRLHGDGMPPSQEAGLSGSLDEVSTRHAPAGCPASSRASPGRCVCVGRGGRGAGHTWFFAWRSARTSDSFGDKEGDELDDGDLDLLDFLSEVK